MTETTGSTPANDTKQKTPKPGSPEARPKRRRWLRWLIVILVLIGVLIWVAPYALSTGAGTRMILSFINPKLKGQLAIDDMSLNWLGPLEIRGFKIVDPEGREVVQVKDIRYARGLLGAAMSGADFKEVYIDSPNVFLFVGPDGATSLAQALEPVTPAVPEPPAAEGPPLELRGRLKIDNATLKIVRFDGTVYTIKDANFTCDLDTLNDITVSFACVFQGGGKLFGEMSMRGLGPDGTDLKNATGTISLKTNPDIDLAPLAAVAGRKDVRGQLKIDMRGNFEQSKADASYEIMLMDFAAGKPKTDAIPLVVLGLTGTMKGSPEKVSGNAAVTAGDAGKLEIIYDYDWAAKTPELTSEKVINALMEGKSVALPPSKLTVSGQFDLARLAKSIPALLGVPPDVEVTSGKLTFRDIELEGGPKPKAKGKLALEDVNARRDGKAVSLEPMTLDFAIITDDSSNLRIDRAQLDTAFADVKASGTLVDLTVNADANLEALRRQLGQIIDIDATLAGKLLVTLRVQKPSTGDKGLDFTLTAEANGVRYTPPTTQPGAAPAAETVTLSGKLSYGGKYRDTGVMSLTGRIDLTDLNVSLGDKTVQQNALSLAHDITMNNKDQILEVKNIEVTSIPELVSMNLKGTVKQLDTERHLDLSGRYEGSWPEIIALAGKFSPGLADNFQLAGKTSGEFKVTGPLHQPEVIPVFRGVDAGTDVSWVSGNVYGLELGGATLRPHLAGGVLDLPLTEIKAGGGTIRLAAHVDMWGQEPHLKLPERLQALQDIDLNDKFCREVLSRVNPIFSQLASVSGKASLMLEGVDLPLSDRIFEAGKGRGHLEMDNVSLRPSGMMGKLLELGGMVGSDVHTVKISGLDFEIRDGALWYKNFTTTFPSGFDLIFSGRMNFDDSIDMVVSVPVGAALLAKIGVKGPLSEYARLLQGARVEIPITGTRMKPGMDISKVDIKPLVDRAIKGLLKEKTGRIIKDLLRPG